MAPAKNALAKNALVKKAPAKNALAKKAPAKKAPAKKARRADLGAPIDGFFTRQPPALRPIVDELRRLIMAAAPEARASLKWGMPFFEIGKQMLCAIGAHKAHVNLILSGAPGAFADPAGLLEGEGKTGRHLKLKPGQRLPVAQIRAWLKTAAERARGGA